MSLENRMHIVADGFLEADIKFNELEFKTPEADKSRLERFFTQQIENAKNRGGTFFDGDLVGINMSSLKSEGQKISFKAQNIKYSQHAGLFRDNSNAPIQALYVNALAVTSDDKLVLGVTQVAEAENIGKVGLSAGAVESKDRVNGRLSLEAAIARETGEELGLIPGQHYDVLIPGWMNGGSVREGNYHLTVSHFVPLKLTAEQLKKYFDSWKAKEDAKGAKTEFKGIEFIPNDPGYIREFIAQQDKAGKNAKLLGKSLDVLEVWAEKYNCDPRKLAESKKEGARVYLPQPKLN